MKMKAKSKSKSSDKEPQEDTPLANVSNKQISKKKKNKNKKTGGKTANEDKMEKALANKSLDELLKNWSDDEDNEEENQMDVKEAQKSAKLRKKEKSAKRPEEKKSTKNVKDDSSSEDGSSEDEEAVEKNVKFMTNLSEKDPEFFEFLKENDQELLNFEDEDSSSDEDNEVQNESGSNLHKPKMEEIEMASDESDFEDDENEDKKSKKKKSDVKTKGGKIRITQKLLDEWSLRLENNPDVSTITTASEALRAAIYSLGEAKGLTSGPAKKKPKKSENGKDDEKVDNFADESANLKYLVEGGSAFNGVVRLCLTRMEPAIKSVLRISPEKAEEMKPNKLRKAKKWTKLNKVLKAYTLDLAKFLGVASDDSVVTVVLKHIHGLLPFYAALPKPAKSLTQRLIDSWSKSETESVRILSFLCIVRLTRSTMNETYESTLKHMYMAYVRNCKFTSPNTWPLISFMRRSLAELLALDPKVTYNHAFVYIRQLSISLRNAITAQKKDTISAVYNWQFVHSIHLWAQLLGSSASPELEPLVFPLVQVMVGTIKLVYTSKYYPLRFNLCSILTKLSKETEKFIPVLPYYLEVLNKYNFNQKTKNVSMKPVDFGNILKLSKSQLLENGSKDAALDGAYSGIAEYLASQSHKIAFPELVIPCVFQIKDFLKRCKVGNYCKKMKTLLDKIEENSKFIVAKRNSVTFGIRDVDAVAEWESKLASQATPLTKFFNSWRKTKDDEKMKRITDQENLAEYEHIPKVAKKTSSKKVEKEKEEFKGIFGGSDEDADDDELDDEERFELKEDRGKKRKRDEDEQIQDQEMESENEVSGEEENEEDLVEDFNIESSEEEDEEKEETMEMEVEEDSSEEEEEVEKKPIVKAKQKKRNKNRRKK